MKKLGVAAAVGVALVSVFGCATQPARESSAPRGWLAERGLDLSDVVSVRLALGPGLLAHARVTRFVAIGAGELGSVAASRPGFTLDLYQLGWIKREGGLWTERRVELGLSTMYLFEAEGESLAGDRRTFGPPARRTLDVGVDLHLALIGAAADVRIDELFDFVAGVFGADPLDDDDPAALPAYVDDPSSPPSRP